jgi:hypothetical protein
MITSPVIAEACHRVDLDVIVSDTAGGRLYSAAGVVPAIIFCPAQYIEITWSGEDRRIVIHKNCRGRLFGLN